MPSPDDDPVPVGAVLSIGAYDRDDPTVLLTEITKWSGPNFRRALREVGSGRLTLQNDDPALALIPEGTSVLKFRLGGAPVHAVLVESAESATINIGEEAAEATTLSGRGTVALLEASVIYPEGGVDREPFSDTRRFDWTSYFYDDSAWDAAATIKLQGDTAAPYSGAPKDWPDSTAYWIWGQPFNVDLDLGVPQPVGFCLFRKQFTVSVETPVRVFVTADDGFEVYIDGVLLIAEEKAYLWGETRYEDVFLSIDTHTIAIKATNIDRPSNPSTNIAAVICSVFKLTDGGASLGALLVNTDDTWTTTPYPTDPVGLTVGALLMRVLQEGSDHGPLFGMVTVSFDEVNDSAGNPWPGTPEFAFQAGTTILGVIEALIEGGYADIEMSPNVHRLDAWIAKGGASGVALVKGDDGTGDGNLLELSHSTTG